MRIQRCILKLEQIDEKEIELETPNNSKPLKQKKPRNSHLKEEEEKVSSHPFIGMVPNWAKLTYYTIPKL
jgi:hypothetical protein